jgi:2-amino-4-hydroxy-6-hydroxymethyldihydropteridine diphosphokinase
VTGPPGERIGQTAYVGVGSNLGNKVENCRKAIAAVAGIGGCTLRGRSDFFMTEPVGVEDQDWYVNAVLAVSTLLSPHLLLKNLLDIESEMGRKRVERWGPRVIDLDLLLYGMEVLDEPALTLPHPRMHLRKFVLVPIVQLSPDLVHPVLGRTMAHLLAGFQAPDQRVVPMPEN